MTDEFTTDEARSLVRALRGLNELGMRVLPEDRSTLDVTLREHLGTNGAELTSTAVTFPMFDQANLQLALTAYEQDAVTWSVIGMPFDIGNYGGLSLAGLASGTWHGPSSTARQFESVAVDVDETVPCLRAGIILTEHDGVPVAALLYPSERYQPQLNLEVVGQTVGAADAFLDRIRALMQTHNVFRGKTVAFSFGVHGNFGMTFVRPPRVARDDVILGGGELDAIEAHSIGISARADELRAARQHVKRGLLLYGPPGTGKTHTISYLLGQMPGRTTVILSGPAVEAVGQAGTIARALQPATIVIEDVDLIALDRGLPGEGHNPLLFQLLNEMDGLADDADVLFILTTNRVDALEPALVARPGRIDQAIEMSLPGPDALDRLLRLYGGDLFQRDDGLVARLAGAAPAFVKELARRAHLMRLRDPGLPAPLSAALDEMLAQATPLLRRTLAGPTDGPDAAGWL